MVEKKVRLATWVPPEADKRLRVYAAFKGQRIGDALTDVLRALPTPAELARQADEEDS
jgi:hypothetical protein